jgi:hypothetical protein
MTAPIASPPDLRCARDFWKDPYCQWIISPLTVYQPYHLKYEYKKTSFLTKNSIRLLWFGFEVIQRIANHKWRTIDPWRVVLAVICALWNWRGRKIYTKIQKIGLNQARCLLEVWRYGKWYRDTKTKTVTYVENFSLACGADVVNCQRKDWNAAGANLPHSRSQTSRESLVFQHKLITPPYRWAVLDTGGYMLAC